VRFKFRKFQYGDLPAIDVVETIAELNADMEVLAESLVLRLKAEGSWIEVSRVRVWGHNPVQKVTPVILHGVVSPERVYVRGEGRRPARHRRGRDHRGTQRRHGGAESTLSS